MTNPTERPEERDSELAEIEKRLEASKWDVDIQYVKRPLAGGMLSPETQEVLRHAHDDLRTLINEVKERDRFHAESERQLRKWQDRTTQAEAKTEQMEEALREIAEAEVDWAQGVDENFTRLQVIAERALSPSDTEEPR